MDAVEEVKSRLNIEDVVGEYVQLKRSGRNFKGLSPFTNEKSPSLMVSPEKQIWHDFSSGRGGNIFSFVMELEGLDFRGALELLARKAGVDLEVSRNNRGPSGKDKERLYAALNDAANFYQRSLTKNKQALEYLRQARGFSKETIIEFRLGYSPSNGELTKFLLNKGYTADELKAAGLSTPWSGGLGDMFRSRIMVPLMDGQGVVVGFTARLLGSEDGPKYINTPSTVLYDKSKHIYGLSQAKQAIRTSNYVVVAEGNLDVISSHQAGIKQVVATAGTAMTSQHFAQLKRFTGDVRLSFDADRAGQTAAERAIPLAQAAGVNLSIITLPEGKDPDELVRKSPESWQNAIDNPSYAVDWLISRYQQTLDTSSAVGKTRLTDVILAVVRKLQDPVEQDHYLGVLAGIAGSSPEALRAKLAHEAGGAKRLRKPTNKPKVSSLPEYEKRGQHFLGIMLLFPSLRELMQGLPDDIFTGDAAKVFEVLRASSDSDTAKLVGDLKESADYVKMLALLAEEGYGRTEADELSYQTTGLRSRLVADYVRTKKQILSAMLVENPAKSDELLAQALELDKLQQNFKFQ